MTNKNGLFWWFQQIARKEMLLVQTIIISSKPQTKSPNERNQTLKKNKLKNWETTILVLEKIVLFIEIQIIIPLKCSIVHGQIQNNIFKIARKNIAQIAYAPADGPECSLLGLRSAVYVFLTSAFSGGVQFFWHWQLFWKCAVQTRPIRLSCQDFM